MKLSRCCILAAAVAGFCSIGPAGAADKTVKITTIIEHPAMDAMHRGTVDGLAAEGFVDGKGVAIEFQSAQGDAGTAGQIAKKFVGDRPDLIVPISTISTQAMVAAAHGTIPIVFTGVSDPLGAKLVSDLAHPGGNVTGVSNMLPLEKHLALIREVLPKAKRVGILYNPGEANSVSEAARFKRIATAQGIEVFDGPASDTNSVATAARSLVGKVDALYVPTDSTVVSALEAVIKVAIDAKLPFFAADTASVKRGAIAAEGYDYYDEGLETGKVAAQVLRGAKPGDIPIRGVQKTILSINSASAAKMGVTFPPAVLARADDLAR